MKRRRPRRAFAWIVRGVALIAAVALAANVLVLGSSAAYRYGDVASVPARPIGLVLGAGLDPDGSPSAMLADRLDAGAALLRAGKVRALLFSGDNGSVYHNELAAMEKYALAHGVPRDRIALDYAGFDTYDSCYRARAIFGVRAAIVVTQEFHLARAVYLCRSMGIDAVGIARPDWGKYGSGTMFRQAIREVLSRTKAVWEAGITHRLPSLLGSPEPLPT